jgi:hypothetical protein
MTAAQEPSNDPEPMTLAQLRALLEQAARVSGENTRSIAEMRAAQRERAAQHDREMAEMRALQAENSRAIAEMRASQARTDRRFERLMESHQDTRGSVAGLRGALEYTFGDVSTLKGWGMEFLCERRPGAFAKALNLSRIELLPAAEIFHIAIDAAQRRIVSGSLANDLHSGDVYFYGRRAADDLPVYLIVQASFEVSRGDVKRASAQAETLETILRHDGPPEETGIALPVVAGTRLRTDPDSGAVTTSLWDCTYVQIENGNNLTA